MKMKNLLQGKRDHSPQEMKTSFSRKDKSTGHKGTYREGITSIQIINQLF